MIYSMSYVCVCVGGEGGNKKSFIQDGPQIVNKSVKDTNIFGYFRSLEVEFKLFKIQIHAECYFIF